MSDLISREEAIKAFAPYAEYESNLTNKYWVARIRHILNDMPSIDAVPVKHGRWKYISFLTVECSECKTQIHDLEYSNFCPNCGSRMWE